MILGTTLLLTAYFVNGLMKAETPGWFDLNHISIREQIRYSLHVDTSNLDAIDICPIHGSEILAVQQGRYVFLVFIIDDGVDAKMLL